jgi:hypothetical protein
VTLLDPRRDQVEGKGEEFRLGSRLSGTAALDATSVEKSKKVKTKVEARRIKRDKNSEVHSSKLTSKLIYDLTRVVQYERSSENYEAISKYTKRSGSGTHAV